MRLFKWCRRRSAASADQPAPDPRDRDDAIDHDGSRAKNPLFDRADGPGDGIITNRRPDGRWNIH